MVHVRAHDALSVHERVSETIVARLGAVVAAMVESQLVGHVELFAAEQRATSMTYPISRQDEHCV